MTRVINLAVQALGGQGGGVLIDWIVDLAEHAGWTAQATSVAGVAQRTGATIYYVEMAEPTPGREPVLALMPVPGEVDVVIASELMEAGRAVQRGFVTPDRTTVITSSHRTYSADEKVVPGNGTANSHAVLDVVRREAKKLVIHDMQALAVREGSVISASLFGGLAGSAALPFSLSDFEAVIERSGIGVKASLAALRAAAELARGAPSAPPLADQMAAAPRPLPQKAASGALQPLLERIRAQFPQQAWPWLGEGLARVTDWADAAYGEEYLYRVQAFARRDRPEYGHALTVEAARWIAVAMSYDDVIRVADLKTRGERSHRIRREVGAGPDDVSGSEEYFHPQLEEILGMLPRRLAASIDHSPRLKTWLAPRVDRGRRVATHTLRGYLQLRFLAGLRRWRRGNRRHAEECAHIEAWLTAVERALTQDYALAVEMLRCRRLVKGYSDTHARGASRFDRLLRHAESLRGQHDAAAKLAALCQAALRDAEGRALDEQERLLGLAHVVAGAS